MSDCQEKLDFYEKAWNEEHEKHLAVKEKLEGIQAQMSGWQGEYQQLQSDVRNLENRLEKSTKHAEQIEAENTTLQTKVAHLEKLHEGLQKEAFWEAEMLLPFAEALELFPTLEELTAQPDAALSQWAEDVAEGLENLPMTFEQTQAERVKQCLLAQWVYVRWLELCHADHADQKVAS